MSELEWTTDKPTEPGWYWTHHPTLGIWMYKLYSAGTNVKTGEHELWTDEQGEYDQRVESVPATHWMGPIEPPDDPLEPTPARVIRQRPLANRIPL